MPQSCTQLPHEVDHIRAQKHNGLSTPENLCWSCALCNSFKGSDVSAYTPDTDELTRLFNPRVDIWNEHFDWSDGVLIGKTNIAAATIGLLRINSDSRVSHRRLLIKCHLFPPKVDDF
jgi:hypothetical protein